MKYFCLLFNEDYTNIIKYYCSEKIKKHNFNLTKPCKYISIYKIKKTNNYKLKDISYDKIISILAKDEKYIKMVENIYNTKFKYLRQMGEFILKNNFINYRGIGLLDIILKYEFKKFGLKVKKINEEKINEINAKNENIFYDNDKKYTDINELLLIKNINNNI